MSDLKSPILINILTRTSGRPVGFEKCRKSIINQTYKNIRHIVCYDDKQDLDYLDQYEIEKFRVKRKKKDNLFGIRNNKPGFKPYNLYCNKLLNKVKNGWILFLDDDDMLIHEGVLEELVNTIKNLTNDTLILWQTRYPDGRLLPEKELFQKHEIKYENIDTACFGFHSDFRKCAKWDAYRGADYRFLKNLESLIPEQKWIFTAFTQKNNFGDHGRRNDIEDKRP